MQQQFQQMGLKPGNPDGTYLQNVPLAGITSKPQVDIAVKGRKLALVHKKDYIAISQPLRSGSRREELATSCSWAMAWWRRSMAGTTTRAST